MAFETTGVHNDVVDVIKEIAKRLPRISYDPRELIS